MLRYRPYGYLYGASHRRLYRGAKSMHSLLFICRPNLSSVNSGLGTHQLQLADQPQKDSSICRPDSPDRSFRIQFLDYRSYMYLGTATDWYFSLNKISYNSTFRHPNVYSITVLQPWSNQNFFLGVRFWGFSLNFVLFSYSLGFFYSQRFIGGLKPPINTHTVTASYQ